MALDKSILGSGERFSELLEAKIEAEEGVFDNPYPFFRTALRGLASRLNSNSRLMPPQGFVTSTELYIHDLGTGIDGFSREPMPYDVQGHAPVTGNLVRMIARDLVREALGDEFADAVDRQYEKIAAMSAGSSTTQ